MFVVWEELLGVKGWQIDQLWTGPTQHSQMKSNCSLRSLQEIQAKWSLFLRFINYSLPDWLVRQITYESIQKDNRMSRYLIIINSFSILKKVTSIAP